MGERDGGRRLRLVVGPLDPNKLPAGGHAVELPIKFLEVLADLRRLGKELE